MSEQRRELAKQIQKQLEKTHHIPIVQIESILCCFDKAWEDALKHHDELEIGSFVTITSTPHKNWGMLCVATISPSFAAYLRKMFKTDHDT